MNHRNFLNFILAASLMAVGRVSATEPVISNMHASQVAGTKLVELSYDISGGTPPYSVTVQGSADGGATWTLPVTTLSGNVGSGISAGLARKVTWNAGQDWNGQFSEAVRFRVNAADATFLQAELVAYYPFEGNADDASGNGHNGVIFGATATTDRFGRQQRALSFNGTSSYVSIGTGINPQQFSISAWIWLDSLSVNPVAIVSKLHNQPPNYYKNFEFRVETDGRLQAHIPTGDSWPAVTSNRVLSMSAWNHVAVTYDGIVATLYINGTPEPARLYGSYVQSDVEVTIGARPEGGFPAGRSMFFPGRVDEVRIYDRALTLAEIQQAYQRELAP